MRRINAGTSGTALGAGSSLSIPHVGDRWTNVLRALLRGRSLRAVQQAAIVEANILNSRQHLVVCAPTNSGKSLIGQLVILDALFQGRRAVLLEPLRALAQEQADELAQLMEVLVPSVFERAPRVRLSTGDYRLESEMPADTPHREGEILVATPERLDAILRNPAHAEWAATIGAVVVDEAHLLADTRRGPTLELVTAAMLAMPAPPRLALLSATVGEPERLCEWLHPCQLVTSSARSPLRKEVWHLDSNESPDEVLCSELAQVLAEPGTAAIVFVYRREAAEALARRLSDDLAMPVSVVRTFGTTRGFD